MLFYLELVELKNQFNATCVPKASPLLGKIDKLKSQGTTRDYIFYCGMIKKVSNSLTICVYLYFLYSLCPCILKFPSLISKSELLVANPNIFNRYLSKVNGDKTNQWRKERLTEKTVFQDEWTET